MYAITLFKVYNTDLNIKIDSKPVARIIGGYYGTPKSGFFEPITP